MAHTVRVAYGVDLRIHRRAGPDRRRRARRRRAGGTSATALRTTCRPQARRPRAGDLRRALDERASGRFARMIMRFGKGGDFRDFEAVSAWARGIAREPGTPVGRGD
ncbi:hypothetical protein GCM10010252_76560 [Streptomyces aureoverticillatus]|nr:hypothetical protein GCM10010252_76560 [Streptomyces aureoverticillatus]